MLYFVVQLVFRLGRLCSRPDKRQYRLTVALHTHSLTKMGILKDSGARYKHRT